MNKDEIIELAKKCGYWSGQTVEMNDVGLERFAALIAAAEREAICPIVYGQCGSDNDAQRIVDAIRARGEK